MALTRKFLSAMGIDADKQDEIIASHSETVTALKDEIAKYKADAEKLAEVEAKLADTQKELDDLKSNTDSTELKDKYDKLKKEYDSYKESVKAESVKASKEKAYRALLKEAGVSEKRFDTIIKVSGADIDKLTLDKEGNVENKGDVLKGISENWSDFVQTSGVQGVKTPTPPQNNAGAERRVSRAAQIASQYHENLYGKVKED